LTDDDEKRDFYKSVVRFAQYYEDKGQVEEEAKFSTFAHTYYDLIVYQTK